MLEDEPSKSPSTISSRDSKPPEPSDAEPTRRDPAGNGAIPPKRTPRPKVDPDEPPPPETRHDVEYYRTRFVEFARDCLKVRDKSGKIVPFVLNSTQRKVLETIRQLRNRRVPPRVIILKARQVGISTLIEALLFHACITNPNRMALVLAHKLDPARALFGMSRRFYRKLPPNLRWKGGTDNRRELSFQSESQMLVEVQGDARAYAAQYIHLSEFAMYKQAGETLVAIMQTCPGILDSLVAIESTAKGIGNKFHAVWARATAMSLDEKIPEEERGWTPIFIPWFDHEEYQRVAPKGIDYTSDELALIHQYKLKGRFADWLIERKMTWRRWCISTNLDGDEEMFAQEYPGTPEEAFLLSGRPAFDTKSVQHYVEVVAESVRAKTLAPRCEIESDPPGVGKVDILPHDRGRLRIFAPPRERCTYVIGADPSEGDPGSDYSPLAVLCQQDLDFVATWYGKAPPDVLALHAIDLARYYNEGLIINEANNHGILFHETVLQVGYSNLYFRRVSEESVAGEVTEKPGFLSTRRNREHLFNTLRKYVRMRLGKIPCPRFVEQMQSLVYVEGKAEAQTGAAKDLLIAGALCLMAHRGSMANPLEPLPEEIVRSVGDEIELLRERDPARAEKITLVKTGMTCEAMVRSLDAIYERERRERRFGVGGLR